MQITTRTDDNKAVISLNGRFDFHSHRAFRQAYEAAMQDGNIRHVELNLAGVEYIDSSALGMLLLLREQATAGNKRVSITGARETVKSVLQVANFQKLFDIR
jgi:HptB-dependent secretion and biofilm anti anti-sigma factor